MRAQFSQLFPDQELMKFELEKFDYLLEEAKGQNLEGVVAYWVGDVQRAYGLQEMLPVYELGADMHTHIDPVEELKSMVGDDKVIVVKAE